MTADASDALIQIPADSVSILDLLLRAGLGRPELWTDTLEHLQALERDEMLDALTCGAMPLPQLTWEWGTNGRRD